MGRNAIIFHGTGAEPGWIWYPWLAGRLRARGYDVETPHHPGTNVEPIGEFLPRVLAAHTFSEDTVLVGHSGGAALLLAVLEHLDVTVAQAVLVAGYSTPPNDNAEPVLQDSYGWAAIRSHVRELVFLNSVEDEFGCDADQGRAMFDRLGGTLVVRDDGHFTSETLEIVDRLIA
ncbi:alpha/beta fold hydrolase [Promicromonospora sp. NPDC023805]|uniref:RBBP9/YdeN family alpha/beta hydrolase n=1 Tax=Promicromonospora sp. NPDC023805 TaxID=3154696 RepID=UPI0033C9780F